MRAAAAAAVLLFTPSVASAAELPLGPRSLHEQRTTTEVAPGVGLTRIVRNGGPWRVNVLSVDRAAISGRVGAVLSNGRAAGVERVSSMARRSGAVAGVNGNFFDVNGNPLGALAVRSRLLSEPLRGRAALLVPRSPSARPLVARLRFAGEVALGQRRRLLDGIDRPAGAIPACGGRGGDRPTEAPNPTITCTDPSELVLLTPSYGSRSGAGLDAVVEEGAVTALRRGGRSRVPAGGYVLTATGSAERFLRATARSGSRPRLSLALRAGSRRIDPSAYEAVVSAGPGLLRGGRIRIPSSAEGFTPPGAPWFFQSFGAARNPRTLAGVRADGGLLLVTVDGRRRGWSAGLTLLEAARVMRSLGARDALNLDGGGSTAMTVGRRLVNRPSDPGGERAVANGLFVLP